MKFYVYKMFTLLAFCLTFSVNAEASLYTSQEEFNERFADAVITGFNITNQNMQMAEDSGALKSKSQYWTLAPIEHNSKIGCLVNTKKELLSVAIDSLINSKSVVCCRLATEIAMLKSLEMMIGKAALDSYAFFYGLASKKPTTIGNVELSLVFSLTKLNQISIVNRHNVGYAGYIKNDPLYNLLHPFGTAKGENVVLCKVNNGVNMYIGFGPLYKDGPKTSAQIKNSLYESICKPAANPVFAKYKEIIARLYRKYPLIFMSAFDKAQENEISFYVNVKQVNEVMQKFKL